MNPSVLLDLYHPAPPSSKGTARQGHTHICMSTSDPGHLEILQYVINNWDIWSVTSCLHNKVPLRCSKTDLHARLGYINSSISTSTNYATVYISKSRYAAGPAFLLNVHEFTFFFSRVDDLLLPHESLSFVTFVGSTLQPTWQHTYALCITYLVFYFTIAIYLSLSSLSIICSW